MNIHIVVNIFIMTEIVTDIKEYIKVENIFMHSPRTKPATSRSSTPSHRSAPGSPRSISRGTCGSAS